jgi:hypothetical protein
LTYNQGRKNMLCVLGGEIAVPCNSQSATARLNSCRRMLIFLQRLKSGVESQARRNCKLRTVSDPEGSSTKRILRCAAGKLDLS